MDETRKRHGPAFWVIVALIVLLGYPLSFGPACWISERTEDGKILSFAYGPIIRVLWGKDRIGWGESRKLAGKYLYWGIRRNAHPYFSTDDTTISWGYRGTGWDAARQRGFVKDKYNPLFERPDRPPYGNGAGFGGGMGVPGL